MPGPGPEPRAARHCQKREDEEQRAETWPAATKQRPEHDERGAQQDEEDGCALDGVLEGQVASVATVVATFELGRRAKR